MGIVANFLNKMINVWYVPKSAVLGFHSVTYQVVCFLLGATSQITNVRISSVSKAVTVTPSGRNELQLCEVLGYSP